MKLSVIGLNYQTAPVEIRARLAFPAARLADAVRALHEEAAAEAVIVSTCNRTELYCVGEQEDIIAWWAAYHGLTAAEIRPYLYAYGCSDTVRHAFRVACGLDSMVLGETQILGQMKAAVQTARENRTVSTFLNALFQRTFACAKEVRSHSSIGDNVVSMASAAVRMAERVFGGIGGLNVLFVGAGEMNEAVATYFAARQPQRITIANRTLTRAAALCSRLNDKFAVGAEAVSLEKVPQILSRYDAVISCTAAETVLIRQSDVAAAQAARGHKPLFLLDLAVPNDIAAEAAAIEGVVLRSVDDMAAAVAEGRKNRAAAAEAAEAMVKEKVAEFIAWEQSRQRVPLICALRDEGERARKQVLDSALRQLAKGTPPEEVLQRLSVQLTNKLLHSPTRALNKADPRDAHLVSALSEVYRLPQGKNH